MKRQVAKDSKERVVKAEQIKKTAKETESILTVKQMLEEILL